jgi:ATP/maltotriose-dependent transcriptional regulator MalT
MTASVDDGRAAFERRAWGAAYAALAGESGLGADDLERLAVAAYLTGRDEESARAWERAHHERALAGDPDGAARCAVWLAVGLLLRGEMARGAGWLARAERLLDDAGGDAATARGYLLLPAFLQMVESDPDRALAIADEIAQIGKRFGDRDLVVLGILGSGQAHLALGDTPRGLQLLDEVMVAVSIGDTSPITTGLVYCAVIEACMFAFDLRRAAEWTDVLDDWCATQPDLVPYRGQCLVHRSQVLLAHGEWSDATASIEQATARLAEPAHPALGLALYQQGELHRLQGELDVAERAYRAARERGREPTPGFALLLLAEDKLDAAVAAVRRMRDESADPLNRPAVLAACVDIQLAVGDTDGSHEAADELEQIASVAGVPLLRAIASYATGAVRLARGEASAALAALRKACATFRDLDMPYEVARTRVQIALACRALGDHDTAADELDLARTAFERLGARIDLRRTAAIAAPPPAPSRPGGLTERECEVLRLVAAGQSNRAIAATLVISEHTVGRHLQNIFTKVGVSSRAAATSYAHEHGLV